MRAIKKALLAATKAKASGRNLKDLRIHFTYKRLLTTNIIIIFLH